MVSARYDPDGWTLNTTACFNIIELKKFKSACLNTIELKKSKSAYHRLSIAICIVGELRIV